MRFYKFRPPFANAVVHTREGNDRVILMLFTEACEDEGPVVSHDELGNCFTGSLLVPRSQLCSALVALSENDNPDMSVLRINLAITDRRSYIDWLDYVHTNPANGIIGEMSGRWLPDKTRVISEEGTLHTMEEVKSMEGVSELAFKAWIESITKEGVSA